MISFADSTNPAAIPHAFTHVAGYANGRFAWSSAEIASFPRHILIGVESGNPGQAKEARVLDVERFDAVPSDFPPFVAERRSAGHNDATAYTSILGDAGFGIEALTAALSRAGMSLDSVRLWVAWWWGRPFPPTAAEVHNEVRILTGLTLPVGTLWACQWQNGTNYDSSVLYGRDDFTER